MREQRAFRRPGRAAGVDQHGGIVGARDLGRNRAALGSEQGTPVDVAAAFGATHGDDRGEPRAERPRREDVVDRALVDDREPGATVVDPILQRLGPEQHRQRHRDGAEPIDRDVRDGRLDALRHHDRDAVATRHAELAQRCGEPSGIAIERAIGDRLARAVFVLVANGDGVGRVAGPARAAGLGDVELLGHVPTEAVVQLGVAVFHVSRPRAHRVARASRR